MATPVPHLYDLQTMADELSRNGYDIHTINIVLNGQDGGWDVTIEATDDHLGDHRWDLRMDYHGNHLRTAEVPA